MQWLNRIKEITARKKRFSWISTSNNNILTATCFLAFFVFFNLSPEPSDGASSLLRVRNSAFTAVWPDWRDFSLARGTKMRQNLVTPPTCLASLLLLLSRQVRDPSVPTLPGPAVSLGAANAA